MKRVFMLILAISIAFFCPALAASQDSGADGWELLPESRQSHPWERMPDESSEERAVKVEFVNDLPWNYTVSLDECTLEAIDSATPSGNTFILASGIPETRYLEPGFHSFVFKSHTDWVAFGYSASDSIRFEEGYTYRMTFLDPGGYSSKHGVETSHPPERSIPASGWEAGILAVVFVLLIRRR
ncbi:hypothetical protein ASZ90_008885 [hydrocarbon metagenome]|uniref:Uncharacterized protein n=1 Tax=hydrocarbon metagenome TaxID=938273 RepID=A0A0W8FKE0_9ZZZZ